MTKLTKLLTMIFIVSLLMLGTELVGGRMVRKDRLHHDPVVWPLLPFVLMGQDRTGAAGGNTLYLWYGTGVIKVCKGWIWKS